MNWIGFRNLVSIVVFLIVLGWAMASAKAHGASRLTPRELHQALMCIHKHEGAWNANTGNGYFGGLQMDATFERAYGSAFLEMWGHAHRWPPYVQLVVAMRAYKSRGFGPWPNTRRMCGV